METGNNKLNIDNLTTCVSFKSVIVYFVRIIVIVIILILIIITT